MENWTPKALSALCMGNIVHKNNWHAIKADPRFGPWLADFSEDDLKNKVKADIDMIQEGISGVNQPKDIIEKIKANPKFRSIFNGVSDDDIKNKFDADLEFFGVNLPENELKDKVCDFLGRFENWKLNVVEDDGSVTKEDDK